MQPDPISPEPINPIPPYPTAPPQPPVNQPNAMDSLTPNIIHPTGPPLDSFSQAEHTPPPQTPFQPAPPVHKPFVPPTAEELASSPNVAPGIIAPPSQVGAVYGEPLTPQVFSGKKKKPILLIALATALVVAIGGGAVFGLYLPNQPGNVWKTGLDRSGKALNMVYDKATNQSLLDSYKKSEITFTTDVKMSGTNLAGSANIKFDSSKSNGTVDFSMQDTSSGSTKQSGNLKFITNTPNDSLIPDIYFQFNGLKLLGIDEIFPGISSYDGKWISADHKYLESFYPADSESLNSKLNLTAADYKELAKAAMTPTTDYVLSSNSSRAVLVKKSFVGKESVDGLSTFHFKAGINKEHAKEYCKAVFTSVMSTNAYKKVPFVDKTKIDSEKSAAIKDCQDSVSKDIKDSEEFDVWVDAKYKIIYKIRIYENDKKVNYTEVGQTYKGGDDVSMFVVNHNVADKSDIKVVAGINTKTNTTKASFSYISKGDSPTTIVFSLEAKPYKGEIDAAKPTGAVNIQDVLKKIGLDPSEFTGSSDQSLGSDTIVATPTVSSSAKDTERKVDQNSMATQLEVYFNDNGGYPVAAAQLNNDLWITANMKGADLNAFRAPGIATNSIINTATPTVNQYGYVPLKSDGISVCSTAPCADFKLYYRTEAGEIKSKLSLNTISQ